MTSARWRGVVTITMLAGSLSPAALAAAADCNVPSPAHPTIQAALDDPLCEAVHVAPGTYHEHLVVARDVRVVGAGADGTIIDGEGVAGTPVVAVGAGAAATIGRLTVTGGLRSTGSGIQLSDPGTSLALHDVDIVHNLAALEGGGIYAGPGTSLTVRRSRVVENSAHASGPDGCCPGGGIRAEGAAVEVVDSHVTGNYSENDGGAISMVGGTLSVFRTVLADNQARVGDGSAIAVEGGTADIGESTFVENSGNAPGQGVANLGGSVSISDTAMTFEETFGGAKGIYNTGWTRIWNSTLRGAPSGTALVNERTLDVVQSTIAADGRVIYSRPETGTTRIAGSILADAGQESGPPPFGFCSGSISSGGYNVFESTDHCTLTGDLTGVVTGVNPALRAFGDHGGPTPTMSLFPRSVAVDAIPVGHPACAEEDQRGVPRRGACDIGAYELVACDGLIVDGRALEAVVFGTDANDQLLGSTAGDVVLGFGGHDAIVSGRGDDVICGAAGNDRIRGGAGSDRVRGGDGNDRLRGGPHADTLRGEAGDDRLRGGPHGDFLEGGGGRDLLNGGAGRDFCSQQGGGGRRTSCERRHASLG